MSDATINAAYNRKFKFDLFVFADGRTMTLDDMAARIEANHGCVPSLFKMRLTSEAMGTGDSWCRWCATPAGQTGTMYWFQSAAGSTFATIELPELRLSCF